MSGNDTDRRRGMQWNDNVPGHCLHTLGLWPANNLPHEDRGRASHSLAERQRVLLQTGALDLCPAATRRRITDQRHGGLTPGILGTGGPARLIHGNGNVVQCHCQIAVRPSSAGCNLNPESQPARSESATGCKSSPCKLGSRDTLLGCAPMCAARNGSAGPPSESSTAIFRTHTDLQLYAGSKCAGCTQGKWSFHCIPPPSVSLIVTHCHVIVTHCYSLSLIVTHCHFYHCHVMIGIGP